MGRVVRTVREFMHGWNAFQDPMPEPGYSSGPSMPFNGGHRRGTAGRWYSDRSMVDTIKTRIALDVAMVEFYHAMVEPTSGTPLKVVRDSINERLTLDANIDQTAFAMKVDMVMTMLDNGDVAVCPIDTSVDPNDTSSYEIGSLRVGTVDTYYPREVVCNVYDDRVVDSQGKPVNGGVRKQVKFAKTQVAIVENPFYAMFNAPNGRLQTLLRNIQLLQDLNEAAGSGKLDLLIQLPQQVRGDKRILEAQQRRDRLREQLRDDEFGIGYIDITEKVIQLNRPINNTLPEQIDRDMKYVMDTLCMTAEVLNGTATGDTMNAYMDRIIEPISMAFQLEFKRKFLTSNARTRGHSIETYRDPLKFIPLEKLGETVDHLLRNAAVTANEIRPKIGFFPSDDPRANELANPNMPVSDQPAAGRPPEEPPAPTPIREVASA